MALGGVGPLDSHDNYITQLDLCLVKKYPKSADASDQKSFYSETRMDTPPKTNMEPENGPLEKEIPIGNHHFQVPC